MTKPTRPRLEEFLLALLWTLSAAFWGYFGFIGYTGNLSSPEVFLFPGFILSYFFLCLAVFGLRFAFNVYLRIPNSLPGWLDSICPLVLGTVLFSGFLFSLVTLTIVTSHLLVDELDSLMITWGFAAALGILVLAVYQLLAGVNAFEPFLVGLENQDRKVPFYLKWLLWLNKYQRYLSGSSHASKHTERKLHGPLVSVIDLKTSIIEEKEASRPGLEKVLVAHGGWHVAYLGFTTNNSVIFAASDGAIVHYQAGGRKGTLFPPEIKFWDLNTGRVQSALLGSVLTFITRDYKTPPGLVNYRFIVPTSGGKFGWLTGTSIKVGDWNNDRVKVVEPEEEVVLEGYGGFSPIAFNPDGTKLAWCDISGHTFFWDLEADRTRHLKVYPLRVYDAQTGTEHGVWGLTFSPDGTKIATIGENGILLQNVYTGWRWFADNDIERDKITSFSFNYNGFEMAVGLMVRETPEKQTSGTDQSQDINNTASDESRKAVIRIWDLSSAGYTDIIVGKSPVLELAYSPDNRMLTAVDEVGILRLWDFVEVSGNSSPLRLKAELDLGITGRKTTVTFSPDLNRIICSTDNRILIWNVEKIKKEWAPATDAADN